MRAGPPAVPYVTYGPARRREAAVGRSALPQLLQQVLNEDGLFDEREVAASRHRHRPDVGSQG
ncbi:hypothetical protein, partial [Paenarthrobacter aurescens]|uniref:hypothetical protein n=1 Tax=Paenarthrobacter aurescens TaxID=43663 RepID=UPI0021BF7363